MHIQIRKTAPLPPKKGLITVAHDDPYHQTNILETRSFDPVGDHCIVIFKGK